MTTFPEKSGIYNEIDWSSFSNPSEAIPTHTRLNWDIDFDEKKITGLCEHVMLLKSDDIQTIDFDSASSITLTGDVKLNGKETATHFLSDLHPALGRKISVVLPNHLKGKGKSVTVSFEYVADETASAIQWLDPSATKGGKHPYLFTQSQAIHARSLLPCVDSPGVKVPYTAKVTAPKWCTVLMSALQKQPLTKEEGLDKKKATFFWEQPVPIPAYLIALAAGNLSAKDISDRVRIWAEPEVVAAAHTEFSETEEFLKIAEDIMCPYEWTRYDVLCLPPSFPYGGMENPCLTFATPTLLAGDKSLADVIAHEIAHSWTGNLVTNLTWDHFWLNEGWTVWLERKITSRIKGSDEFGKLSAQIGWKHLKDDVQRMGEDNQFTALVWPLSGQDPDDAFSSVPYEKGFNLLNYLEGIVGSENFGQFAKKYIATFKFSTVTSGQFRDLFMSFFTDLYADDEGHDSHNEADNDHDLESDNHHVDSSAAKKKKKKKKPKKKKVSSTSPATIAAETPGNYLKQGAAEKMTKIKLLDWDHILTSRGLLSVDYPDFSNSLSSKAVSLAEKWISIASNSQDSSLPSENMKGWSSQQICIFLETLLNYVDSRQHNSNVDESNMEGVCLSDSLLQEMDRTYSFSTSKNTEIMFRWQSLCIQNDAEWILPQIQAFVQSQGRMKFVRPLYMRLAQYNIDIAVETFSLHEKMYHPIARKMISRDLQKVVDVNDGKDIMEAQTDPEIQATVTSDKSGDKSKLETQSRETQSSIDFSASTNTLNNTKVETNRENEHPTKQQDTNKYLWLAAVVATGLGIVYIMRNRKK